jgi:bacteriorhodopsin
MSLALYWACYAAIGLACALWMVHGERQHREWMKRNAWQDHSMVELLVFVALWPLLLGVIVLDWLFDFTGTRGK